MANNHNRILWTIVFVTLNLLITDGRVIPDAVPPVANTGGSTEAQTGVWLYRDGQPVNITSGGETSEIRSVGSGLSNTRNPGSASDGLTSGNGQTVSDPSGVEVPEIELAGNVNGSVVTSGGTYKDASGGLTSKGGLVVSNYSGGEATESGPAGSTSADVVARADQSVGLSVKLISGGEAPENGSPRYTNESEPSSAGTIGSTTAGAKTGGVPLSNDPSVGEASEIGSAGNVNESGYSNTATPGGGLISTGEQAATDVSGGEVSESGSANSSSTGVVALEISNEGISSSAGTSGGTSGGLNSEGGHIVGDPYGGEVPEYGSVSTGSGGVVTNTGSSDGLSRDLPAVDEPTSNISSGESSNSASQENNYGTVLPRTPGGSTDGVALEGRQKANEPSGETSESGSAISGPGGTMSDAGSSLGSSSALPAVLQTRNISGGKLPEDGSTGNAKEARLFSTYESTSSRLIAEGSQKISNPSVIEQNETATAENVDGGRMPYVGTSGGASSRIPAVGGGTVNNVSSGEALERLPSGVDKSSYEAGKSVSDPSGIDASENVSNGNATGGEMSEDAPEKITSQIASGFEPSEEVGSSLFETKVVNSSDGSYNSRPAGYLSFGERFFVNGEGEGVSCQEFPYKKAGDSVVFDGIELNCKLTVFLQDHPQGKEQVGQSGNSTISKMSSTSSDPAACHPWKVWREAKGITHVETSPGCYIIIKERRWRVNGSHGRTGKIIRIKYKAASEVSSNETQGPSGNYKPGLEGTFRQELAGNYKQGLKGKTN